MSEPIEKLYGHTTSAQIQNIGYAPDSVRIANLEHKVNELVDAINALKTKGKELL